MSISSPNPPESTPLAHRVPLVTKIGYSAGSIGDSAAYNIVISFFSFFLTTVAGISPAVAGSIIAAAIVWDAITDPLMGVLIDRSRSKYGKRRPFIIGSLAPMSAAIVLIFVNFDASQTVRNIYYVLAVFLFWTAYTAFNISFYSLGIVLTVDDDERIKIAGWREVMAFIGVFVGTSVPTAIVGELGKRGMDSTRSWIIAASVVAVIIIVSVLIMWRATFGKEPRMEEVSEQASHSIRESIAGIWELTHLKPYVIIILSALFACVYMTIFNSDLLYYTSFVIGVSETAASVLFTVMSFVSIGLVPLLAKAGMVVDKRTVYIACMAFSGIIMIAAKFTGIPNLNWAIAYIVVVCIGTAAYWMFIFNFLYDVVDLDDFRHGKKRDGIIMSYYSFILKLGGALASFIMGLLLQNAGFDSEAAEQSVEAVDTIASLFTLYPGVFMLLSGLVMLISPATRTRMDLLHAAHEKKLKGEQYSTVGFEKLLK